MNLKEKEDNYIKKIQELNKKLQENEDKEKHYIDIIEDSRAVTI